MIRVGMKRLRALSAVKHFTGAVPAHRATSLRAYFEELPKPIIVAHHDSEGKVWAPDIKASMELPASVAQDHEDLLTQLDGLSAKL